MTCKIYSYPNNPRVFKVLIAAQYTGVKVEQPSHFQLGVSNKTHEFLAKFPFGKVPAMDTKDGPLFESNAMAYYVAYSKENSQLIGSNAYEKALILQFINMADNEIAPAAATWVYPILGFVQYNEANTNKAKEDIAKVLSVLDQILLSRTFLVGEQITLADITVVCSLYHLYKLVLDPEFRAPFPNVTRWFMTCVNQPQFKAVLDEFEICASAKTVDCKVFTKERSAFRVLHLGASVCGKEKCCAVSNERPAKCDIKCNAPCATVHSSATSAATGEEEEEEESSKPKAKNALDLLPVGKFDMDSWKRFYSNNEVADSVQYFWDKFDPSTFSMYRVVYKFNDELTKVFMSSNLIGGFFQRLEEVRKYAFGSMCVFGKDNDSVIAGMFIFRGPEVPQMVKDVPDYESYTFEKVDPAHLAVRAGWEKFIAWEGDFEGKAFGVGKIYK